MREAVFITSKHILLLCEIFGVRENYRRPRCDDACVSEECAASVFGIHFLEEGNVTCVSFCDEFSPVKLTLSYLVLGFKVNFIRFLVSLATFTDMQLLQSCLHKFCPVCVFVECLLHTALTSCT